jgi:hypothetical protein
MSPQRAQRVRGVPGVGLRTPDGREWLRRGGIREGAEQREYAAIPGWHFVRCAHDSVHPACDDCANDELATFATVKSCARPGKYGNPWVVSRCGGGWLVARDRAFGSYRSDHGSAVRLAVKTFTRDCATWANGYFTDLATFDYLSCFCPLDQPCHVDAIVSEGKRRGVWE